MDTKENLLDAAERAARARGFEGFSYADLSEAVGIRKASIHHHFPRKADLAEALMDRYAERFLERLSGVEGAGVPAAEQLDRYVAIYREALGGGATVCLCVAFSAERENLPDAVIRQIRRFHDASIAWLAKLLDRGRRDGSLSFGDDVIAEATSLLALVEGAQLLAHAAEDVALFDRAVAAQTERLSA